LELWQVEQWAETELPQDRKDVHGEKIAVYLAAYGLENIKRGHLARH
jgi:hypothetical protein